MQHWKTLKKKSNKGIINMMKRTPKEIKMQTEAWLDERWNIAHMEEPPRPQDISYYNGALKALEFAGYEWQRDENGKHILYKSK